MKLALIVDDKEENQLYLRALLESQGYQVDVARHGAEALSQARKQPPDLVISDLLMPVMDGYTLLRQWKADAQLRKTPFMVYTASYNEDEDEQLAMDLGADAFLLKPAEPEEFVACINGALARAAAPGTPLRMPGTPEAVEQQHSTGLIRRLADKMLLLEEANQALEHTRARLAGLIEAVEGIVYEADATTFQFTFVSHQAERLLGYPVKRWLEEPGFWAAHIHPDDREMTVRYCRECTARKENHTFECRLLAADGRMVWVRDIVTFVEQPGHPALLRGIMLDITEHKRTERQIAAFAMLGRRLSAVTTAKEAAEVIMATAHELFGWDACWVQLYDRKQDRSQPVLNMDLVDGRRRDVPPAYADKAPSPAVRRVIEEGAQLILRDTTESHPPDLTPFGDISRPSASLMIAPVRHGGEVIAVLSIQSYTLQAYHQRDLAALEALADYCGGALAQIRARDIHRETEQRFRQLAENIEEVFWLTDPDKEQMLYISPSYERIWGRACQELYARPRQWLEAIHPADRPRIAAAMQRQAEGNYDVEYRIVRPDGTERWIADRAFLVLDEAGKVYRIAGVARDITTGKMAEHSLRESEERFRLLAKAANDAVWDWDLLTDNVWWNEGYELLFGYPLAGAAPSSLCWSDFIHPEDFDRVMQGVRAVLDGTGTYWTDEYRFRRRDGAYIYVLDRGHVLRDATGRAVRMIGGMSDLSERKRVEEKLRELAGLLDKAQDAIIVRDLDHRITFWNQSAERLYGWTAAEVLGRSIHELLYDDPSLCIQASQITLEKGEWMGEAAQITRDRRPVTVECRLTLVKDAAGRPKSFLAINSDVTLRRKIEAQFLRHQRMESIGTLAGGIAHDLNNVLAPVLMSIELLRLDEQRADRLEILDRIESSARRGADLVRQVLSFARGVEGKRVNLNLAHLARDIEKIVRDTFPKGIEFRLRAPRDLWTVSGDPTQLHQVIINLCINARDAMAGSGVLTLTLGNAVLDEVYSDMNPAARPGPYVTIQVADTGPGILPEIQERIFDPFFTTKEPGKGTGLGLSTVLTIVRSHGGFINVQSELGQGAIFKVHLPAHGGSVPSEAAPLELPHLIRGRGELILVVDDEEGIRSVAKKTIEQFGYHVLLAAHGAEAVSLYALRRHEIAVVLTDLAMPVMDGHATITALKALNPAVKIIASSGHVADADVIQTQDRHTVHFVPKPYTTETLLTALDQILRR